MITSTHATVSSFSFHRVGAGKWFHLRYTGRDGGLIKPNGHNRLRCSPRLRRWLEQYLLGFDAGDSNLYRYVGNGPTDAVDLSGLQTTDQKFEEVTGIGAFLGKEMKEINGVMGTPIIANESLGIKGCNIEYLPQKAYAGNFKFKLKDKPPVDMKGVYLKLKVTLKNVPDKYKSNTYYCIQFASRYTKVKDEAAEMTIEQPGKEEALKRKLAGSDEDKAKSKGWFLDAQEAQKNPAYNFQTGGNYAGFEFWDLAGRPMAGGAMSGATFYLCVVASSGDDAVPDTVLGVLKWGYYISIGGDVTMNPKIPEPMKTVPQEVKDALPRWNKIEGNLKRQLNYDAK